MAGHGGTVIRKTTNKKLTKLHIWPITKALTKTNNLLLEPKKWRGTAKKNLQALRAGPVPPPTFKVVPAPLQIGSENTPFRNAGTSSALQALRDANSIHYVLGYYYYYYLTDAVDLPCGRPGWRFQSAHGGGSVKRERSTCSFKV